MDLIRKVTLGRLENEGKKKEFPRFVSGDTIKVYVRIKEGEKERTQMFKGVVIKVQGSGMTRSFTVRKMSGGVGVERTFPFTSPALEKIELVSHGKTRQSRIYFLRGLRGKAAKLQSELARTGKASEKATEADKKTNTAPQQQTSAEAGTPTQG